MGHSLKILLLILLAFVQSITYAQELEIATYTANDGLSQNSVKDIIADKNGRLWIATAQGVNTFDGSEFVNFVSGQPNSLGMINQSVEKLAMDSKGNIWLAGNNGIEIYNPHSFTFSTIVAVPLGDISTFELDEVKNYVTYSFEGNIYTYSIKDHKWLAKKYFSIPLSYFDKNTRPVGKIYGQKKWLNIKITNNQLKLTYQGESFSQSISLSQDFQYAKVVYQPQWKQYVLTITNKAESHISILNQKLEPKSIPAETLAKFNASYIKNVIPIGNKIWIGTEGHGLIKLSYTQKLMRCIPIPDMGIIKNIMSGDDLLYILSVDQGMLVFNKNTNQFVSNSKVNPQLLGKGQFGGFNSLQKTNKPHEFLVYSHNLFGLWNIKEQSYLNLKSTIEKFQFKETAAYYYQLVKSHQNHYLIANNNELNSFDLLNYNITNIGKKYSFPKKITYLKSINGHLAFIGTENGAYTFNLQNGKFKIWQGSQNHLIKHAMFHQGIWWVSTNNGLLKYTNNLLVNYSKSNGLSDNYIYASIAKKGKIWLSTNKGLNSLDIKTGQVQVFDVNNGLCGNEFNSFSFYENGDTLYFGCIGGLVSFEPKKFTENKKRNFIQLHSIWVNDNINQNRATDLSCPLIFGPDENRLTINFSTNNLNAPFAETYYYKLVGKDQDWVNNGSRRDIRFGNLSAGNYKLIIYSISNNGAISKNKLKIEFTIKQVFYKSWWFISLSFIAFAGGIIFYLQRRNKQKRQLLELELSSNRKLASEKSRISRELHDNVGSIATTLVASTYGESENKTEFKNYVKESATDILESLRQSIWVLSEDQISLSQLMARFNAYIYKNTGQLKNYQYTNKLDISHDPMLESRYILPLYRILQECFQNSIKHSKANTFSLIVKSTNNELFIQLKDNGQGTDLSQEVNGYGLNNIKQRAEEINMAVEFTSQPGKGFMVQLKSRTL